MARIKTEMPKVTLNDGVEMPLIGFGSTIAQSVWPEPDEEHVYESVKVAIKSGYQFIELDRILANCSKSYEDSVGQAIAESISSGLITRADLFVCVHMYVYSKPGKVVDKCRKMLENLEIEYIDLLLLDWPNINDKTGAPMHGKCWSGQPMYPTADYAEAWRRMEDCKDLGLVRSIGVCNFDRENIEDIIKIPARHKPTVLLRKSRYGIYLNKLLEDCKRHNIVLGTHCPNPPKVPEVLISKMPYAVGDPIVAKAAERHQKSPAKIGLRYLIQSGILAIPTSYTPEEIHEGIDVLDFHLSSEEMSSILALDRIEANHRGYTQLIELLLASNIAPSRSLLSNRSEVQANPRKRRKSTPANPKPMPKVTLNDGVVMPVIGFGIASETSLEPWNDRGYESIKMAIRIGYRFIDVNAFQYNLKTLGRALGDCLRERVVTRRELFISAMMYLTDDCKKIEWDCRRTLRALGLKYFDLYLLSWPALNSITGESQLIDVRTSQPFYSATYCVAAWKGMENCKDLKLVRSIGLVDFNQQTIEDILAAPARYRPSVHLRLSFHGMDLNKLLEDCKRHDIVLGTYCPDPTEVPETLISKVPHAVGDPVFVKLAKKHRKSPVKICLRYLVQSGILAITRNQTFEQIFENIDVLNFELSPEDMNMILSLDTIEASESGYSQLLELLQLNIGTYEESED